MTYLMSRETRAESPGRRRTALELYLKATANKIFAQLLK